MLAADTHYTVCFDIAMLLACILPILLLLLLITKRRRTACLPPGPRRIPLLGSLPFISQGRGLQSWVLDTSVISHKIATVALGPLELFVINDFELAKDLFGRDAFTGRGCMSKFWLKHRGVDGKMFGIVGTDGSHWRRERRFGLRALKDLGFGKQSLEEIINIEVEEIIQNFLSEEEDFLLSTNFNAPIINMLWQIVAGHRFTPENKEGMEILESVTRMFELFVYISVYPLKIMEMFPKSTNYAEMVNILNTQKNYIIKTIEEHESTIDPEHPRDFVDMYLNEMKNNKNYSKHDLVLDLFDFLQAGTETSSTTLKWVVLYLTVYQDVQDK